MPGPEVLIPVGIELAKKIPVGKVEKGARKKFGEIYREVRGQSPQPTVSINKNTPQSGVSGERVQTVNTKETIAYQNREIGKELLLLEKHLQQGCKITNSKGIPTPCDCCQRHPLTLEGLTGEAVGMSSDPIYPELNNWVRNLSQITTPEASGSGRYDDQYPVLAKTARDFRKKIMGTDQVIALLSPEEQRAIGEKP